MRFAYPHELHAGIEAATVLPLQIEDAPFEAGLEFVVARAVACRSSARPPPWIPVSSTACSKRHPLHLSRRRPSLEGSAILP
ncbi:MAG: hypothetical protein U5Q44_12645 [Dehalococcoidia bacterium]|nr:hypothetical protein [Dehalococcoidia bacterium]